MSNGEIVMPQVPSLGVPEGMKQAGQRVDMRPNQFDLLIETKGYLLAWERAGECPCAPIVDQTHSPDPNCDLCKGKGWIYFGAPEPQDVSEYELDSLQTKILTANNAMLIRGVIIGVRQNQDPHDQLGNWVSGTSSVTVRHENRLGYYDKLTALDGLITYSEIIETDGSEVLETRYLAVGVNNLRSVDKVYKAGVDFTLDKGVVTWLEGYVPEADTRVAIHYLCHPTWLVIEYPHALRVTLRQFKTPQPKSPTGDPYQMPINAIIRYDFLPGPQ